MRLLYRYKALFKQVNSFFNDIDKTKLWFETPNGNLGYMPPKVLIYAREEEGLSKVELFVKEALNE